jgi:hypothetical protein
VLRRTLAPAVIPSTRFAVTSLVFASACTLYASPAYAQSPPAAPTTIAVGDWQLAPSFEVRTRGEYRRDAPDLGGFDFYGRLGSRVRDAWVVSERSRLGLGVERGAVRGQITLQDARAFGTPSPTATFGGERGPARFEPYEAYLEVRSSSSRPNTLRLGRQAVVWGEGRLIGNADFSPTGRSLDAARAHLATGDFDFEALGAILEVPGPLGTSFGDRSGASHSGVQLYGLTAKWSVDPLLHLEAFALARISRSSGDALDGSRFSVARLSGETYTGALRVSGDAKGWTYGVEGAYQLGTAASLAIGGSDISAFAVAGHVAKTLPEVTLTPTFRIGGSYASGDDGSGTYHQFDPLLADPQRFHGQMDLFAWSNAIDVSARAQVVPWTDTTFALEYRYARLAEASGEWIGSYLTAVGRAAPAPGFAAAGYAPITGSPDAELGHELDAVLTWRPWIPLELRAGWSGLLLGDGARGIMAAYARGRADDAGVLTPSKIAHYAYAQATLTMP